MLKVDLGSHRWPSRWPLAAAAVARVHSSNAVKFEEMESTPEFAALPTARDEEATVPYRQILSHHASTACQPQNDTWPVPSLKACGVDTGLGAAGHWRHREGPCSQAGSEEECVGCAGDRRRAMAMGRASSRTTGSRGSQTDRHAGSSLASGSAACTDAQKWMFGKDLLQRHRGGSS